MLEDGIRRWNPWWADVGSVAMLSGVAREITPELMAATSLPHVKDVIGVRRSGKTTTMYQVVKSLISEGLRPKDVVFLNFDDPEINASSFENIQKALAKLNLDVKYLFVDEAQQKSGWEAWVRTLYDTKAFSQIFISGSSASLLSKDMGRVLTGRHLTFSVFPFSFREVLRFLGWSKFDADFLAYNRNKLLHHCLEYTRNGGFPETAGKTGAEIKIILTNIYSDILARDICARFGISSEGIEKVSYHLLSNSANEFSYRSVSNATGLNFATVEKYIGFLKESFMLLTLDFFSYKTKVQFRQNKKAYCIDTGLRNAVSFAFSENFGKLAENAVLIELKRRGKDVYYWKDKLGREVDFLVRKGLKVTELIQVCWRMENPNTKKRELKGLLAGCEEFKLGSGIVLTEDEEGEEMINDIKVNYIPLWKWLLTI